MHVGLLALLEVAVLVAASTPPAGAAAVPAKVQFLFDLGDGSYVWAYEGISDPTVANASWHATLAAAASVGLNVSWAWSSSFGVYILDVGHRSPPGGVGLYLWNRTTRAWDALQVGISSLVLHDGDALAISDNGFDPVTYATLYPIPTPADPYPVTQFRGDAANTGRSLSPAPNQFQVLWDRDLHLQEIPSSPAVGYGRVYVLTLDGLFALDLASGAIAWSNATYHGLSTPALFDGYLLFGGTDGRLHAVDASNGTEVWNITLVAHPVFSGVTSSPKIIFDTGYVGTFNESGGPGEVVAFWATNGTVRWRTPAPASISFSSPAIANGSLFVGVIGKYNTTTQVTYDPPYGILSLNAATGAERWFYATNGSVAASPLVVNSEVVVPAKDGVYAFRSDTGMLLWWSLYGAGVSSPAMAGDAVVVAGGSFGSGGDVSARDLRTGLPRWTFTPNGPIQGAVASADGKVFFSTNVASGTVYALNATSGVLDWDYTPSPPQFIFGSPVVADGLVIAPSDNGHVYAFASTTPALASVVNLTAPSSLAPGQYGNIALRVSAPNGTWDHAQVRVVISAGLDIVSVPAGASRINGGFYADLGPVPFRESRWFNVTVRGNATGSEPVVVDAILVDQGRASGYSPATAVILVAAPSEPPGIPLVLIVAAVATVAIAVVAVAFLVWLRRRRPRGL